jgi:sRNA-binding regulator protein Hfq
MLRVIGSSLPDADVREQQVEEARRLAAEEREDTTHIPTRRILGVKPGHDSRRPVPVKRPVVAAAPKGHEAFLKALETSGAEIVIEKCDGTKVRGAVIHSDKYTVSVRTYADSMASGDKVRVDRVIFKHDISEFSAISPRVVPTDSHTEEGHAV